MTVLERPLYDKLHVEALVGSTWVPLLADATGITIRRGGSREGLGVRTDVGLCTFRLLDAQDPLAGGQLAPGQQLRVTRGPQVVKYSNTGTGTTGWTVAFTANGSGATSATVTSSVSGATPNRLALVTTGTTAVNPGPGATATRSITGLTPGRTYSFSCNTNPVSTSLRTRITFGGVSSAWVSTLTETLVSGTFVATATSASLVLEVADNPDSTGTRSSATGYFDNITVLEEQAPVFTGRIAYLKSVYPLNKTTGETRALVEVTAADAVQIHAATMRYGVDMGADTDETFEERIARLDDSAQAPVQAPAVGAPREVYAF